MKRRDLFRRSLAATVGAAIGGHASGIGTHVAAREFPPGYDAAQELARPDWKPIFLNDHQSRTLEVLSDLIIPETDTPGAGQALVHRFLDLLLAHNEPDVQKRFLQSLAYIDGLSRERYNDAFVFLTPVNQNELLTYLAFPHRLVTWGDNLSSFSGHEHFVHLKNWIASAYYSSEAGMKELGWEGMDMPGDFEGCKHPEGTHK